MKSELGEHSLSANLNWQEVTAKIAAGDHTAFARFYDLVYEAVYWEIKRLSGCDDESCLDILQNTLIKILKCIKPLPNSAAVIAWSKTVAKSETYDWLRKHAKKKNTQRLVDGLEIDDGAKGSEEFDENIARIQWIESQLKQLEPHLQKLISLRYRLGWSLRRIGELLGLSTNQIDGRIRRAIKSISVKAEAEQNEP